MKKLFFGRLTLVAFVAGVLLGCSLEAPSTGHLSISVPTDSERSVSSPSLSVIPSNDGYVRLYVLLNGSFVKLGSGDLPYVEKSLSAGSSFSIDLPASSGYRAFAALGTKPSGLWTPSAYGESDSFGVSAGVYTERTIKVAGVPGTWYASSTASGAVAVDGSLWRMTSSSLTNGTVSVSLASCGTVYSLTEGSWFAAAGGFAKEPWINSSSGIYTVKSGSLVRRSSIVATYSSALANDGKLVVFYYGSDVGYASSDNRNADSVDSTWSSGGLKSFLETSDGASFKTLISDPSSLVKDSALIINGSSSYGFVATSLGTYLYNEKVKSAMGSKKDDIIAWVKSQIESSKYAIALYDSAGKIASMNALAFDGDSSPKYLYVGSSIGLYSASASSLSTADSAPALTRVGAISSNVTKLAAATFAGFSFVAYADVDGSVTVLKDQASVASYPFYSYASAKTGLSDMTFYTSGTTLRLVLSSGDGLMDIPIQ